MRWGLREAVNKATEESPRRPRGYRPAAVVVHHLVRGAAGTFLGGYVHKNAFDIARLFAADLDETVLVHRGMVAGGAACR